MVRYADYACLNAILSLKLAPFWGWLDLICIPASTVLVLVDNRDICFKMCFPDVYEIVRFGKFAGSW